MRTIFNFLGPLTNPAGAQRQLLGVSDRHYQETIAEALVGLGSVRAMVVAAEDGVDELSISARTRVIEVDEGATSEWFVEPGEFGLAEAELERGRRRHAGGERRRFPRRAGGRERPAPRPGPAQRRRRDLRRRPRRRASARGSAKAAAAIDSGAAGQVLDRLIATTAELGD